MRIDKGSGMVKVKRDHASETQPREIEPRITERQKASVRHLVAVNAQGSTHDERVADARLLLDALGIHPLKASDAYRTGPGEAVNTTRGSRIN